MSKPEFEQEYCDRHNTPLPGDLVEKHIDDYKELLTYRWRCPECRIGWVTVGSEMDKHNDYQWGVVIIMENL